MQKLWIAFVLLAALSPSVVARCNREYPQPYPTTEPLPSEAAKSCDAVFIATVVSESSSGVNDQSQRSKKCSKIFGMKILKTLAGRPGEEVRFENEESCFDQGCHWGLGVGGTWLVFAKKGANDFYTSCGPLLLWDRSDGPLDDLVDLDARAKFYRLAEAAGWSGDIEMQRYRSEMKGGPFKPSEFFGALISVFPKLASCSLERALPRPFRERDTTKATLEISLTVSHRNGPANVTISTTPDIPERTPALQCVRNALLAAKFPEPNGDSVGTFRLKFQLDPKGERIGPEAYTTVGNRHFVISGLPARDLYAVLLDHLAFFRPCHLTERVDEDQWFELFVKWNATPNGRVRNVDVKSGSALLKLTTADRNCLAREFKKISFPPSIVDDPIVAAFSYSLPGTRQRSALERASYPAIDDGNETKRAAWKTFALPKKPIKRDHIDPKGKSPETLARLYGRQCITFGDKSACLEAADWEYQAKRLDRVDHWRDIARHPYY